MTDNSKPIVKYVVLKITYNSYYVEPPDTWDWNSLIGCSVDESTEVISVRDFPPSNEF